MKSLINKGKKLLCQKTMIGLILIVNREHRRAHSWGVRVKTQTNAFPKHWLSVVNQAIILFFFSFLNWAYKLEAYS